MTLFDLFETIFEILRVIATYWHWKIKNRFIFGWATGQNVKVYQKPKILTMFLRVCRHVFSASLRDWRAGERWPRKQVVGFLNLPWKRKSKGTLLINEYWPCRNSRGTRVTKICITKSGNGTTGDAYQLVTASPVVMPSPVADSVIRYGDTPAKMNSGCYPRINPDLTLCCKTNSGLKGD